MDLESEARGVERSPSSKMCVREAVLQAAPGYIPHLIMGVSSDLPAPLPGHATIKAGPRRVLGPPGAGFQTHTNTTHRYTQIDLFALLEC